MNYSMEIIFHGIFLQYLIYQTESHGNSESFSNSMEKVFHGSTWQNSIKFHEKRILWKKKLWNSMRKKKKPP